MMHVLPKGQKLPVFSRCAYENTALQDRAVCYCATNTRKGAR